jgi:hypothetical protein
MESLNMRFKGDRVKLLCGSDGVPAGAMGTVIEDGTAPWVELDEAYESLNFMPPQGKNDKLGHYICMVHRDLELCEQASDETPPPARPSPDSGLPPVADASSGHEPLDMEETARAIFGIKASDDAAITALEGGKAMHNVLDQYFSVQETLAQRGSRYGDFTENSAISQHLKQVLQHDGYDVRDGWLRLSPAHREALEMIAQKIARILNGDPNYKDNWHDIQGYARLAEERCESSD